MDTDTNKMDFFDFKRQFSVEIINVDEESDSMFLPKQELKAEKQKNDNSKTEAKKQKERQKQTMLKKLKDKACSKKSNDSLESNFIHKKKKKNKHHTKGERKRDKEKKFDTTKQKDLEPIEMEPMLDSLPLDLPENVVRESVLKETGVNKKDQSQTLQETNDNLKITEKNDEYHQYINDLLAKVSESLIHILEAYYNFVSNIQQCNNQDSRLIFESKRKFTRIKQHFFQLSYCTTNIIILSREKDNQFTDNFLNNTVKLAEKQNKMKLTVQQIQPIYYELISWVKQKKTLQNLPLHSTPSPHNLPVLRQQLSQPTVSAPMSSIPCNVIPKVSIFNSDSQNREIRISLETRSEVNNTTVLNEPSVQTSQQHRQFDKTLQPGFHKNEQSYIMDPLKYYNYQMTRYYNGNVRHDYRPNMSEIIATTPNLPKDNIGFQNKCMAPNCFCQNQSGVAKPMNMRFPALPSYEQSFNWKNDDLNSNANKLETNVDTTRSSVSTDSGFISPQQEISPLENMAPTNEDVQNIPVTPLITHVTSLNPRALQIAEGSCHICGAPTKKKCLGCYQVYYCSYQCQRSDWSQHMNLCKYISASRPSPNLVQMIQQ